MVQSLPRALALLALLLASGTSAPAQIIPVLFGHVSSVNAIGSTTCTPDVPFGWGGRGDIRPPANEGAWEAGVPALTAGSHLARAAVGVQFCQVVR